MDTEDDLLQKVADQKELDVEVMRRILEEEKDCLDLDVDTDEAVDRVEDIVREGRSV